MSIPIRTESISPSDNAKNRWTLEASNCGMIPLPRVALGKRLGKEPSAEDFKLIDNLTPDYHPTLNLMPTLPHRTGSEIYELQLHV